MAENITVTGNVATAPEFKVTSGGLPVASFRLASAQRHFDRARAAWVDDGTNWYTVSAFRGLAEHIAASVTKGQPVIITGRLRLREWEAGGKKGVSCEIDADTVGHDLRWGTSTYAKQAAPASPAAPAEADADAVEDAWAVPVTGEAESTDREAVGVTPF